MGKKWLPDGFAITNEMLDYTAQKHGVEVRRGDFLLVHTGHVERCLASKSWDGYSGGDAPGLAFETLDWLHKKEVAARCRPIRGALKCGRTKPRTPTSRGTGSRFRSWVSPSARFSICGDLARRLRAGQDVRIHVRRARAADHGRRRLAGQSLRHQIKPFRRTATRNSSRSTDAYAVQPARARQCVGRGQSRVALGAGRLQSFPSRPIRFVVPWPAGGPPDAVARLIGQRIGDAMKQQVVIDNRPGANSIIGTELVARSAA